MSQAILLATLILEILTKYAFPLAVKIIHAITAKDDITIEQILALRAKVKSLDELEKEMGIAWEVNSLNK